MYTCLLFLTICVFGCTQENEPGNMLQVVEEEGRRMKEAEEEGSMALRADDEQNH